MLNDGDVLTKIWMLFDIVHKASTAGPAFTRWADLARAELDNIWNNTPTDDPELPLEEPTNG